MKYWPPFIISSRKWSVLLVYTNGDNQIFFVFFSRFVSFVERKNGHTSKIEKKQYIQNIQISDDHSMLKYQLERHIHYEIFGHNKVISTISFKQREKAAMFMAHLSTRKSLKFRHNFIC